MAAVFRQDNLVSELNKGASAMNTLKPELISLTVEDLAKNLNQAGIPPDFVPDNSRLLIKVWRTLVNGNPVTKEQIVQISEELAISGDLANEFLRQVTERDSDDNIIGLMGLSLNEDWAHRFNADGVPLRTWCAWDTLFLPAMVGKRVVVESESPVSGETVSLVVSPEKVESSTPPGAVVTIVTIDPALDDVSSVEAIWSNFCHQVFFFLSRAEAEQWAEGKTNIAILSVYDAYELGKRAFSDLLTYT